ncbi:DUF4282 domain-containing protein [Nocardiopsis kunsanensis]|uniref:DUF4282 domain-containing protein n=1 Tax=Nocardiopsis kunsanensis TaxID=141693 RepID=A0A918X6B3_9ACTN|nr:DUF4282 domain-containing protein [Nocardiopsis kunsanensis]GHD15086.1 hypothetical protein GCM10007147_01810 [Nocardiopsis kunsanensis]
MSNPPEQPYDPSQYYGQQPQQPYYSGGYGAQGYQQGPTAGPGGMAPHQSASGTRPGFFGSLFDFSFKSFVTSRVIPVVWILWLVAIGFGTLTGVIGSFLAMGDEAGFLGFFMLILTLISGAMGVLFSRIVMEVLIVLFRISEDLTAIRSRGGM